ncbi:MAG: alkaline phosphatase family protein, partial [Planctomycetota bacterium]
FAYPWWLDDALAPDFARTVDIHRKPGYDPCELFMDPARPLLGLRTAGKLALRKLGMRNLLDVVPLDPSIVCGSHGRSSVARGLEPILLCDDDRLDAQVPMRSVKDAILRQVFGP